MERKWRTRIAALLAIPIIGLIGIAYYSLEVQPLQTISPVAGCIHPINGNVTATVVGRLYGDGHANYFEFNVTVTNQMGRTIKTSGATLALLSETFVNGATLSKGLPSVNVNPKNGSQSISPGCDYVLYGPKLTFGNATGGSGFNGSYVGMCELSAQLTVFYSSPPDPITYRPGTIRRCIPTS